MNKRDNYDLSRVKVKTEKSRGLLTAFPAERVTLTRFHCGEALSPFVEHYWAVRWRLQGLPDFVSQNLPHPSVNLTFEKEGAVITGVMTSVFKKTLSGNGQVFAVKFLPAGFHPFFRRPLATISNRQVKASSVFGRKTDALAKKIYAAKSSETKIRLVEEYLLSLQAAADPQAAELNALLESIRHNRELNSVEQLSDLAAMGLRSLQRNFREYIGVSPKWVIRRYRLHDAVEQLKSSKKIRLATLAYELGYADQAHFIRDFRKITGHTPASFGKINVKQPAAKASSH